MDKRILKILGLHRAEFERAKSNELRAWVFQAVVALAALLSILTSIEFVVYLATLIALISTFFERRFSYKSKRQRDVAERARRVLLLMEGLGYQISQKEFTDIVMDFSASETEGKKWEDKDYYQSTPERGYIRLIHLLQESAFFSKYLFEASARLCWLLFGVVLFISLVTLFILPLMARETWSIVVAKVISIIMMFLVAMDCLGRALQYADAAHSMSRIDNRLEGMHSSSANEHDVILVLGDYNTSVESAPMIPSFVFSSNRKRLSSLWKKRLESYQESPA